VDIEQWKEQVEEERRRKDWFFAEHWQSPIPLEERGGFGGLDYYPPDPKYRFETELHEHREKKTVRMTYTKGGDRDFIQWGEFRFKIDGEECVLQAYRSNVEEGQLFIPLKDATSGRETYGAGRYVDLNSARDFTADGKWILDLNRVYNPWCIYSEGYTCPLVPPENWLKVSVSAGEKSYLLKK
jgi:uncharacterized protein